MAKLKKLAILCVSLLATASLGIAAACSDDNTSSSSPSSSSSEVTSTTYACSNATEVNAKSASLVLKSDATFEAAFIVDQEGTDVTYSFTGTWTTEGDNVKLTFLTGKEGTEAIDDLRNYQESFSTVTLDETASTFAIVLSEDPAGPEVPTVTKLYEFIDTYSESATHTGSWWFSVPVTTSSLHAGLYFAAPANADTSVGEYGNGTMFELTETGTYTLSLGYAGNPMTVEAGMQLNLEYSIYRIETATDPENAEYAYLNDAWTPVRFTFANAGVHTIVTEDDAMLAPEFSGTGSSYGKATVATTQANETVTLFVNYSDEIEDYYTLTFETQDEDTAAVTTATETLTFSETGTYYYSFTATESGAYTVSYNATNAEISFPEDSLINFYWVSGDQTAYFDCEAGETVYFAVKASSTDDLDVAFERFGEIGERPLETVYITYGGENTVTIKGGSAQSGKVQPLAIPNGMGNMTGSWILTWNNANVFVQDANGSMITSGSTIEINDSIYSFAAATTQSTDQTVVFTLESAANDAALSLGDNEVQVTYNGALAQNYTLVTFTPTESGLYTFAGTNATVNLYAAQMQRVLYGITTVYIEANETVTYAVVLVNSMISDVTEGSDATVNVNITKTPVEVKNNNSFKFNMNNTDGYIQLMFKATEAGTYSFAATESYAVICERVMPNVALTKVDLAAGEEFFFYVVIDQGSVDNSAVDTYDTVSFTFAVTKLTATEYTVSNASTLNSECASAALVVYSDNTYKMTITTTSSTTIVVTGTTAADGSNLVLTATAIDGTASTDTQYNCTVSFSGTTATIVVEDADDAGEYWTKNY